MTERYAIAPQMADYDRLGQVWVPYLMFFHTPDFRSGSINTDSLGFRFNYEGQSVLTTDTGPAGGAPYVVAGGSFVFGVGASADSRTVPSVLSAACGRTCLNFGGRAYSSTQELLLFTFYHKLAGRVSRIVVISGVNNLILHYLSADYPEKLGTFFFWNQYNRQMNEAVSSLKQKVMRVVRPAGAGTAAVGRRGHAGDEALFGVLERDICRWKEMARSLNAELDYVLQPFANWISKKLTREEKSLFAELDRHPHNQFRVLKEKMGPDRHSWFAGRVKRICRDAGVRFYDSNEILSGMRLDGRWLYVDRAHFTDEGNAVMADVIQKEVIGA